MARAPGPRNAPLRWQLAGSRPALFDDGSERIIHPEFRGIEFLHVRAKRIINKLPAAARVPFEYTINVYRGCSHACTYCYARPTHEYLNLNLANDFDTVIVVKVNAVERLRAELTDPKWGGGHIAMGTNTDPYQRCEGRYQLTRGVLEALVEARNPFSILTKSPLVLRDLDVLQEAARHVDVSVNLSIGTLDEEVWRASEPGTPHPRRRVDAVRQLSAAGIRSGVLVAPILPGLSDSDAQLDEVAGACVAAGAVAVSPIALHLRPGVKDHYLAWLRGYRPDLLPQYAETYPRSYASKTHQRDLSGRVAALVAKHGGVTRHPTRMRTVRQKPLEAAAPTPRAQQLTLDS